MSKERALRAVQCCRKRALKRALLCRIEHLFEALQRAVIPPRGALCLVAGDAASHETVLIDHGAFHGDHLVPLGAVTKGPGLIDAVTHQRVPAQQRHGSVLLGVSAAALRPPWTYANEVSERL